MKARPRQHTQTRQRQRGRAYTGQNQVAMQNRLTAMRMSHAAMQARLLASEAELAQLNATLASTQVQALQSEFRASHDALTGLANQRYFVDSLSCALAQAQLPGHRHAPPCVMYIDLDGFKGVNDTHGHLCGDDVLKVVAARLTQALRAQDLVARLGGDEFACLLSGEMTREQLLRLARKLFQAVAAPMQLGTHRLHIAPSLGIAQGLDTGDTASALLARADAAMYQAKRHASRIVCSADLLPPSAPLSGDAGWNGSDSPQPPSAACPGQRPPAPP